MAQLIVVGIQVGAIYVLFSVGFTIIFGVHRILNMAQGSILAAAGLLAYVVAAHFKTDFLVTLIIGAVIGLLVTVTLDFVAFRPLRATGAPEESALIASIGASLVIVALAQVLTNTDPREFPARVSLNGTFHLDGITITELQIVTILMSLALAGLTTYYIRGTRSGRVIRAVSLAPRTAALMGIRTQYVYMKTFAISGALTGIAAVMVGLYLGSLNYDTGTSYLLIGVSAIVIGGMGSIPGAVIASFSIGLIEVLTLHYISSTWSLTMPFILLFIMLLIRPQGIFGSYDPRSAIGRNN